MYMHSTSAALWLSRNSGYYDTYTRNSDYYDTYTNKGNHKIHAIEVRVPDATFTALIGVLGGPTDGRCLFPALHRPAGTTRRQPASGCSGNVGIAI